MITSTTPYKLAEIIRDTWPGLYRAQNKSGSSSKFFMLNSKHDDTDMMYSDADLC